MICGDVLVHFACTRVPSTCMLPLISCSWAPGESTQNGNTIIIEFITSNDAIINHDRDTNPLRMVLLQASQHTDSVLS